MNEARRIIVAMSKPLAEVAKTIDYNVHAAKRANEELLLAQNDLKTLQDKWEFSGYDIECTTLDLPKTVCTHWSCVKHVKIGSSKIYNTIYSQICHNPCLLRDVPTETRNNRDLMFCACMDYPDTPDSYVGDNVKCKLCKHSYRSHVHITYHTKLVEREFLGPEIMKDINAGNHRTHEKEGQSKD